MKKIESIISPFVENQFPSFYKEEGPQFIAFVKAYYEWMESANNVMYQSRKLTDYRDVDTTIDEFIVQFKEKYLKNIQFDTATNKQLLVKNSLDLYRSKGTERSIDLFFKLVYGTSAEVRYPADNILRLSDGVWERPEYLEITHSRYNIDYVGKQVVGALSGAKAFVEKFIRRRTSAGYVDLLYISGRQGEFTNGEVIGLNINNQPVYDRTKRAKLLGSVKRVLLQDRGRDFRVGDIVTFEGDTNGSGGLARVEAVSEATGIVDFIFIDGGYGYTLNAESIISEKVITLDNVVANTDSDQYFKLFEQAVEPIINATFTSATANLTIGDSVFRYAANGQLAGAGKVIDLDQSGANGTVMISHVNGVFTNAVTYYTTGNVVSFYANTVEDRSISGKVMGIPEVYTISVINQTGTLTIGDAVMYKNTSAIVGQGLIQSITETPSGNTLVLTSARGTFPIGQRLEVTGNSSISANVAEVNMTVGVYEIKKFISTLKYSTANNNELPFSSRIYRYDSAGKKIAEGLLLTVSHDSGTATGNLTFVPIKGYFTETDTFYADSNTSQAAVVTYTVSNTGGDYVASEHARLITQTTNTSAIPLTTSFGSGASFGVGTLGDTEDVFIGTDLVSANGVGTFDYDRVTLTVASSAGFTAGDRVYQETSKIGFNANSSVNATSGFITLPTANTRFTIGDIVRYQVATGNTALTGLFDGDYYYIALANSTGVILSYPYRKSDQINSTNFFAFANNKVNEDGHYLYKQVHGTVFEVASGVLRTKDNHNIFGNTGGTANTTTYANSNVTKYGATTNTAINATTVYTTLTQANQAYLALPVAAAAFGFPKNPQGDSKNTIFSCLSFNKFTIGSIGTLAGVDPGSDYNVDPYVLAYQPYISGFNRKDFVINISDSTGVFVVGERVNQTLANLVYYDLKVDDGAYGNTFDEKITTVNTKDEIQSANDFILYPSNTVTFNTTDQVNSNTDFIEISSANQTYVSNSYVRYYTAAGNTALSGASNNAFYFVAFSNSSGITLSSTAGADGANLNITQASNVATFNSNTSIDGTTNFISIASANTLFANGQQVRYITSAGNTAVTGLTNNALYYVRYANTTGLVLSETISGANVDITALNPGGTGHFLRYYNADFGGHTLVKYENEFANDQRLVYRTPASNTVIAGLANNTAYYIVNANTVGFQLSDTRGGSAKAVNATAGAAESHTFSTVPGFLPGDRLYVNSSPVVNVTVQSIYTVGANGFVRVSGNTGTLTTNTLYSYSNPYVSANVSNIALYQITSTAKGIVKSANTTEVSVKRLTFENTFKEGSLLIGDASGVSANVVGITEDLDIIYPIGLNADIEANVITANGQITSLHVVDSGIGYSNGEVLQYTSSDGARSGSIKIIVDGYGIGQGYYRSSKGFLSEDMYIHDGDYYQEYSYEILSKISVDRYADMFKKVMHTAGTKFFGSALVVEEDSATVELSAISTGQEFQFNAATDVSSANETITIGAEISSKTFNALTDVNTTTNFFSIPSNPFADNDVVKYTTISGNVPVNGLANNTLYYIVQSNSSGVKLSATANGSPITISIPSYSLAIDFITGSYYVDESTNGHILTSYVNLFANDDIVRYSTATSNTVVQGLANNTNYYIVQTSGPTVKLSNTANGTPINITSNTSASGASTSGHYLTKTIEE